MDFHYSIEEIEFGLQGSAKQFISGFSRMAYYVRNQSYGSDQIFTQLHSVVQPGIMKLTKDIFF